MDNRVILQVPMSKTLKERAEAVSADYGFSSLQEIIRVLLHKLAKRTLDISIQEVEEITHLSSAAQKRYKKAITDIKKGKDIYKPKDTEEFFKLLRS